MAEEGELAAAVFRWVCSWRLSVGRPFALVFVLGLAFSFAGSGESALLIQRTASTFEITHLYILH